VDFARQVFDVSKVIPNGDFIRLSSPICFSLETGRSPMTMQVGMIADGGNIVLASDTRWTTSPFVSGCAVRHGGNSHKIQIDDKKSIAIACARDKVDANRVADAFIQLRDESEQNRARRMREIGTAVANTNDLECIVAFAYPNPALWFFQYINQKIVSCEQVFTYVFGGDSVNASIFLIRNYYDFQSIDQLKRLGAQMIVAAGKICPDIISGLEIVYLDKAGVHSLSIEENRALELEAKELDSRIGKLILGDSQ
jgi:hypothetical protein